MNPGQRILPSADRDSPHLLTDVRSFEAPAPTMRFEDAQAFIRRAAAQLEVGDQSEEQGRDRVAAICEECTRMSFEKFLAYDVPISDDLRREYDFMNLSPKKLAQLEFRLSLTPNRLAARYIAWMHDALGTNAPNPLSAWLKEMEADIQQRYRGYNPHRLFRGAERQVFALVGLYASTLLGWIEDTSAILLLNIGATGCSIAGLRSSPELTARLAEQRRGLRVWAAVLKIVEDEYLKEAVLPVAMRCALDLEQLRFSTATSGNAPERAPASEARALAAEARSRVKTLFANACSSASLFHCHQQLLLLAAANLNYSNRRRDYMLMIDFLDEARGSPDLGNGPSSDTAASTKPEQTDQQVLSMMATCVSHPRRTKYPQNEGDGVRKATSSNPGGGAMPFLTHTLYFFIGRIWESDRHWPLKGRRASGQENGSSGEIIIVETETILKSLCSCGWTHAALPAGVYLTNRGVQHGDRG
jgi:hypothetical protein